jgi:hypothetical protein
MSKDDGDVKVRPGRIRSTRSPQAKSFLNQVLRAAKTAGHVSGQTGGGKGSAGRSGDSVHGRGGNSLIALGVGHAKEVVIELIVTVRRWPSATSSLSPPRSLRARRPSADGTKLQPETTNQQRGSHRRDTFSRRRVTFSASAFRSAVSIRWLIFAIGVRKAPSARLWE